MGGNNYEDLPFFQPSGITAKKYITYDINEYGTSVGAEMYGFDRMPSYAFYGETGISTINIIDSAGSVASIGEHAFDGCWNLINIINFPTWVSSIGEYAFNQCNNLELSSLPDGLTYIKPWTFGGCTKITLSSLPWGIEEIQESGFNYCTSITLSELPETLIYIGSAAFKQCYNLALTSIPDSVDFLGDSAFYGCTGLKTMKLKCNIGKAGGDAEALDDGQTFGWCDGLTHVWLSEGIEDIYAGSNNINAPFKGCSSNLVLYTDVVDANNVPSGWVNTWDNYSELDKLTVIYNTSESDFNNIVNSAYGETIY